MLSHFLSVAYFRCLMRRHRKLATRRMLYFAGIAYTPHSTAEPTANMRGQHILFPTFFLFCLICLRVLELALRRLLYVHVCLCAYNVAHRTRPPPSLTRYPLPATLYLCKQLGCPRSLFRACVPASQCAARALSAAVPTFFFYIFFLYPVPIEGALKDFWQILK